MPQHHRIVLCTLPLFPSLWVLFRLLSADVAAVSISHSSTPLEAPLTTSTGVQLLLFTTLGLLGYLMTNHLIPSIRHYMIKRGICGKDLGKKGSQNEDVMV